MKKLTFFLMALLFSIASMAEVTATWSIAEGATVASFTDVTVTFSGVDSVGRKLDGIEVTEVVSGTSYVNILHALNEDGTTKSSSTMSNKRNGLSVTYSASAALTDGQYRIVIPAGVLTFAPRRKDANGVSLPVVKNVEEFVLNFTVSGNAGGEGEGGGDEAQTDTATVTTMQEVITALGTRSQVVVLFNHLKPVTKASASGTFYDDYMPDGTTKLNMNGHVLPADFDCYGTYVAEDNKFTVDSILNLHGFANLYLLKSYYEQNSKDANILKNLNITEPVIVTAVDGANVFVQYAYARNNAMYYDHLVINGTHSLKVGDQIATFGAKYNKQTSLTLDEENTVLVRNAYFSTNVTSLGTITSNNSIKYASLTNIKNIEGQAAKAAQLPNGGVIVKKDTKYFYTIGTDSLEIRPAAGVEIESFVGKEMELAIKGVVDYCNTADAVKGFIATSINEINTNYSNISLWLKAAAEGNGEGSLKNPVVVTHSEYRNYKQYIFIGDATGGLCLIGSDTTRYNHIKTGYTITNISGRLDLSTTTKTPQLTIPSSITVVDTLGVLEPVEVTIAELLKEEEDAVKNGIPAIKYANRLIKIRKVVKGTRWIGNNARVYPLIQGNDTLPYASNTLNAYHTKFSTTTPMSVTGIVDFRCINSSNLYSIYPRSIEDVKDDFEQPVISPAPGTYYTDEEIELTITCNDPAMTNIYYTFDPTIDPTIDECETYEDPISISKDTTIWYAVEYGEKYSEVYSATYKIRPTSEKVVTATWSIAEGATIESFENVTVTFAGVDSVGRQLDGVAVTEVVSNTSAVKILYSVDDNGTATAIGVLPNTRKGLAVTYAVAEDKGYDLVEGKILKNGNYRIVIPQGVLVFNPRRKDANGNSLPVVKNVEEFVLNFTIKNDYKEKVDPTAIDAAFTANPADGSTITAIKEVVITFTEKTSVSVNDNLGATPRPDVWPFLNQVAQATEDELGDITQGASQPVAPMYCQVVEGAANAVRFYIASELLEGVTEISTEGSYTLTIPAGVILFSETETNKAITLNYTVKADKTNVDIVVMNNIYTVNGTVVTEGEFHIFTITGQDVTNMNGRLSSGVYVVRTANAAAKVVIK